MTKVVNINDFRQPDVPEPSPLFFDVDTVPPAVADADQQPYHGSTEYVAVVRHDTKQVLGMHHKTFNLIRNNDFYPYIDEVLLGSNLNTAGIVSHDELSHDGARSYRHYILPRHSADIARHDACAIRLTARNAYDGSTAPSLDISAYRINSSNVIPIDSVSIAPNDATSALTTLNNALQSFNQHQILWRQCHSTPIPILAAERMIKQHAPRDEQYSELRKLYAHYTEELGHTRWAFINTLAHWATHQPSDFSHNLPAITLHRERRVRHFLQQHIYSTEGLTL